MAEMVKVSARIPADLVEWIDAEVVRKKRDGHRADRSEEIIAALRQRQISLLSEEEREQLFKRLGL
ncbi:MAG: hypothetical protein ABFE07_00685 [Armatimonadia bacterium]